MAVARPPFRCPRRLASQRRARFLLGIWASTAATRPPPLMHTLIENLKGLI